MPPQLVCIHISLSLPSTRIRLRGAGGREDGADEAGRRGAHGQAAEHAAGGAGAPRGTRGVCTGAHRHALHRHTPKDELPVQCASVQCVCIVISHFEVCSMVPDASFANVCDAAGEGRRGDRAAQAAGQASRGVSAVILHAPLFALYGEPLMKYARVRGNDVSERG
jgi:hypothetical protein